MNKLKFVLCVIAVVLLASPTSAEQLASHGFEDGSLSPFIGFESTQTTASTDVARTGSYSAKMEEGGVDGSLNLYNMDDWTEGETLYIKYYQYFPSGSWSWSSISATGLKQMKFGVIEGADGWPLLMFKWSTDHLTTHCYFSPNSGSQPTISTPALNTWHKVEVYVVLSNSNGGFWWKMDDTIIAGSETFNTDTWPALSAVGNPITMRSVRFAGGNGFPSGGVFYVDDVEVWRNELPGEEPTPQPTTQAMGNFSMHGN